MPLAMDSCQITTFTNSCDCDTHVLAHLYHCLPFAVCKRDFGDDLVADQFDNIVGEVEVTENQAIFLYPSRSSILLKDYIIIFQMF